MLVQPYLNFDGRTEEAINFYTKAVGAKLDMLMRYKDAPDMPRDAVPPGGENKVIHASFRVDDSVVMASDCYCKGAPAFQGITLSVTVKDEAEADRVFNALSEGGKVGMPLGKTFFSPRFGMLEDKFGLAWMVMVPAPM
jgi:PhnB protein